MVEFTAEAAKRIARTVLDAEHGITRRRPLRARWHKKGGGGGGGRTPIIRFEVKQIGYYSSTQSGWSEVCSNVLADVLDVTCQTTIVRVNDEVVVWDPDGCWFNLPQEYLLGAHGQAVLMEDSTGDGLSDCREWVDYPDLAVIGGCWWLVQHLCCVEEVSY